MVTYTPRNVYEESFGMNFNWEKHLYPGVYRFHDLMHLEYSTPIELQNIFWMNIATSGVGKSQSRKRLIAEPLEYMMHDKELKIPDFEVCNFTQAGKFCLLTINFF